MVNPNNYTPIRIHFGVRGWAAIATAVIALGAVTVLAVGFLVVLLPVLILAPFLYRLLPKSKAMPMPQTMNSAPRTTNVDIIDAEFTVVGTPGIKERSGSPPENEP